MKRGMIYKTVWIVFLIVVAVLLILPTVGEKRMEIVVSKKITVQEKNKIKEKFAGKDFHISEEGNKLIIVGSGNSLTDAVMNGVKIYKGVLTVKFGKHWVEKYLLAKKINLGLDLQGGMQLVLRANYEKMQSKVLDRKKNLEKKIALLKKQGAKKNKTQLDSMNDELKSIEETKLDEKGNLKQKFKKEITAQALELLRNRVDKFGVSEPSIRPSGVDAIEIQLPGVQNPKAVKASLGTTGRLEYRFVNEKYTKIADKWLADYYKDKKDKSLPQIWEEQKELLVEIAKAIKLPANLELLFFYQRDKDTKRIFPTLPMALDKDVALSGTDIHEATVGRDDMGQIVVQFKTTALGATKLSKATSQKNKGKRLAIMLDNKVRNAPHINEPINTGNGNISGGFSYTEAQTLARIIKEGALPVDLQIIEERTVGPSLGQDAITSGIKAIAIGLLGIMIFMLIYYKGAGIISDLGLILNMIFMLAILSLLGFTLTLPGIAAFILTVGMSVDANVIVYERIKEEIAMGKSVRMAIVNGFDKAFWTIMDANLTTVIAAFILSQFGTGPIKGFANTLLVGIISSVFVVLYITKFIFEIISLRKSITKLSI